MEESLHQIVDSLSHYLQGFYRSQVVHEIFHQPYDCFWSWFSSNRNLQAKICGENEKGGIEQGKNHRENCGFWMNHPWRSTKVAFVRTVGSNELSYFQVSKQLLVRRYHVIQSQVLFLEATETTLESVT